MFFEKSLGLGDIVNWKMNFWWFCIIWNEWVILNSCFKYLIGIFEKKVFIFVFYLKCFGVLVKGWVVFFEWVDWCLILVVCVLFVFLIGFFIFGLLWLKLVKEIINYIFIFLLEFIWMLDFFKKMFDFYFVLSLWYCVVLE